MKRIYGALKRKAWDIQSTGLFGSGKTIDDIHKTIYINPQTVVNACDSKSRRRELGEKSPKSPIKSHGVVANGDWDKDVVNFEEMDVWHAFKSHFRDGHDWNTTDFYFRVIGTIQSGQSLWGCEDENAFKKRLAGIDALYQKIKTSGYQTQPELDAGSKNEIFVDQDEVHVNISRKGEILFADGRHRLCIAKLLGLESIPVKVGIRHSDWETFRKDIAFYAHRHGGVYAKLNHPDLQFIDCQHPSDDRFEIIKRHLPPSRGTLLDIGSHWGFFCQQFTRLGFECTAVEALSHNVRFMKGLRDAEGLTFKVHSCSIFDIPRPINFEVVLALNIFHHFIKTEENLGKLKTFLRDMNTKSMIFQPHIFDEPQMEGSFVNFQPEEFVQFVIEHSSLSNYQKIGTAIDKRDIFLLAR